MQSFERSRPDAQVEFAFGCVPPLDKTSLIASARSVRDRVTLDLRGLGPRLRARAAEERTTPAALVRRSLRQTLGDPPSGTLKMSAASSSSSLGTVKVTLRMSRAHARLLSDRARASDRSQGTYVSELIDGAVPPPLHPDHGAAITALTRSTDSLAALSADVSAFLRILGRVPSEGVYQYRESLLALAKDVRVHLATAASLIALLERGRRPQR
jgi:hypothetical protein